jgi:serine/threonine-protein kinase RsbW
MILQISLDLPDETQSVPICRKAVRSVLRELSVDDTRAYEIEIAVSEAAANVIRHAYDHPGNRYLVAVQFFRDCVRLQVADQGRGFLREAVPDPDVEQLGGRGLWLIEHIADLAVVRILPGGGCLLEAEFSLPHPIEVRSSPPESAAPALPDPLASPPSRSRGVDSSASL